MIFFFLFAFTTAIEVNLMLPLDTVTSKGFTNQDQFRKDFQKLKDAGLSGVMSDVWWGIVEQQPGQYDWSGYKELFQLVRESGLHLQAVMSFHQCGGGVGDTITVELPKWAKDAVSKLDGFFTGSNGFQNPYYISFSVDDVVITDRTPIQIYRDFMQSFRDTFSEFIEDGTINEIQVGMGPAGEAKYPAYPLQRWTYCGIGEFQCYDKNAQKQLAEAAEKAGHPEWAYGPENAGNFNSKPPSSTGFFGEGENNYQSEFGKFFLGWYSDMLKTHVEKVLSVARDVFGSLPIAGKIAGIHWWYNDVTHAAEVTAGYYNINGHDAYEELAQVFAKTGARMDFTCLEMSGTDNSCASTPEAVVEQAYNGADAAGIEKCGENALELCGYGGCNRNGFDTIVEQSKKYGLTAFTYLRMTRALLDDGSAWSVFSNFIERMKN